MIRVVLAQKGTLIRRALAELLAMADDVCVVAELGCCDDVVPTSIREHPHVAVLDYELPGKPPIPEVCVNLFDAVPDCRALVILERSLPTLPGATLARMAPRVGLLATDASPSQFVESVRRLSEGRAVLDVDIAVAALSATNPLTVREQQVLLLATQGAPPKEIAAQLFLTDGTVRNYLSRITTKTSARTLIEAIRRAQQAGWV